MGEKLSCKNCINYCTVETRSQGESEVSVTRIQFCDVGKELAPCDNYKTIRRVKC